MHPNRRRLCLPLLALLALLAALSAPLPARAGVNGLSDLLGSEGIQAAPSGGADPLAGLAALFGQIAQLVGDLIRGLFQNIQNICGNGGNNHGAGNDGGSSVPPPTGTTPPTDTVGANPPTGTTPTAPPATPADEPFDGTVRADGGLNVRSSPWGPIIGLVNDGSGIKVTGRNGDWYTVEYNGGTAYVHSDYVDKGGAPPVGNIAGPPQVGPDGFVFPVNAPGCKFQDEYDRGTHANDSSPYNNGTDIFNARGTPLVACRTGKMGECGTSSKGGNYVNVIDGNTVYYYAHLTSIGITHGVDVAAGTYVGALGNTGNAIYTQPHVHFSIVRNETEEINPFPLLAASYKHGAH